MPSRVVVVADRAGGLRRLGVERQQLPVAGGPGQRDDDRLVGLENLIRRRVDRDLPMVSPAGMMIEPVIAA